MDVQQGESSAKSGSLRSSIYRSRRTAPMRRIESRTTSAAVKSLGRSASSPITLRRLSLLRPIRQSVPSRKKSQHCAGRLLFFDVSLRGLSGKRGDDLPESLDVLAQDRELGGTRPVTRDEKAAAMTDQQRERASHMTARVRYRARAGEFSERPLNPLALLRHSHDILPEGDES